MFCLSKPESQKVVVIFHITRKLFQFIFQFISYPIRVASCCKFMHFAVNLKPTTSRAFLQLHFFEIKIFPLCLVNQTSLAADFKKRRKFNGCFLLQHRNQIFSCLNFCRCAIPIRGITCLAVSGCPAFQYPPISDCVWCNKSSASFILLPLHKPPIRTSSNFLPTH